MGMVLQVAQRMLRISMWAGQGDHMGTMEEVDSEMEV